MSSMTRAFVCLLVGLLCSTQVACNMVPRSHIRQSQLRSQQLYQQTQSLAADSARAHQMAQGLAAEKARLAQQNASLRSNLDIANKRLDNLNAERSQLQDRYVSLLNRQSPLSDETTRRFQELARKYPDFDFDPQTGVSKFHSDILFDSGSARLKNNASPILGEFANILSQGDARQLNILVVGHTDDQPIVKASTRSMHPTNWHLSADRAVSVLLALGKHGISERRMGATGYSKFQPVVPNSDDRARQRNRRVEIFVLAPDAAIAGWDPAGLQLR